MPKVVLQRYKTGIGENIKTGSLPIIFQICFHQSLKYEVETKLSGNQSYAIFSLQTI